MSDRVSDASEAAATEALWRRRALWAALGCLAFLTLVGDPAHRGGNTASRLATVESLVHRGTFDITDSPFRAETVDYVRLDDGRFVSTKPPLLPVVAALVYAPMHALGLDLVEHVGVAHRLLIFAVETLPHAALLYFGFALLALFGGPARARGWTFLFLCFGFFGAGYATTLNNHSVAAAAALGGVYYCARIWRHPASEGPPALRLFVGAGLALGLAPTLDLPTALLSAVGFALVAARWPRRAFAVLAPVALLPVAAHLYLTWLISGSVIPIYARPDLYQFEGGYWTAPVGMDALDEPKWLYLLHVLFGHHGIFLLTPLLGVGALEAARQLRVRGPLWRESVVALVSALGIVVTYLFKSNNYGGACIGFRWLIPVMPLLLLLCLPAVERAQARRAERPLSFGLALAFLLSAVTFVNAAVHPWSHSGVHWLFHQVMDTGANL